MKTSHARRTAASGFLAVLCTVATAQNVSAADPAAKVDFAKDVQTLLETKCLECHNPSKVKGDLLMDSLANATKGGETGPGIVPGQPDKSEIVKRVALPADHDDVMPPKKSGSLTAAEIDTLKRWVAEGAQWPQGLALRYKSPQEQKAFAAFQSKLPTLQSVQIMPASAMLETQRDFQQIVVQARFSDATTMDVTRFANLKVADANIVKVEGDVIKPNADGKTELVATIGSQVVKAPIEVKGAKSDRPVSFRLDVMPVFLRSGCNQGGCHGAARGKDGFRLSLFGFDPAGDYNRITREMVGRRVNLAIPEESTLIEKSIGSVPHTGNDAFEKDSAYYKTVLEWIKDGAPDDKKEIATVTGVDIYPKESVLEGKGASQQITVRATYSDGTDRDVTNLVLFSSNNDPTAAVTKGGLVTSGDRGEAFILARFDVYSIVSQVLVIPDKLKYQRPQLVEANYIDKLVNDKLDKLRVYPSAIADDQEFVRRLYIDLVGVYPTPEELRSFLADTRPDKRTQVVDALLQRKEFTEMWVMKWAELLQIRSGLNNNQPPFYKNALLYYNWLSDRIAKNQPLNEIVVDILSATGGTVSNPPVNYFQMERDPLKVVENIAQVFMGMRIQCAQCHNHPFDRWTMNDYYGFQAFIMQVGRKQTDDPQEVVIYNSKGGEARHFLTQAVMKPKFLGGSEPELKPGDDRRAVMAKWLASPENPYFARNIANIMWAHFFGPGIVDPVDDVRISNPPSNPELLAELSNKLQGYNYDFRKLIRDIVTSMTYQRTSQTNESNESDKRNFSHAMVRRVRAEVLLDAISQITGTPNKFQGLPLGARAVQIADGAVSNYFLTTFGRAKRESVCSCEVKMEPTLSQALHLMNGDAVNDRIRQGNIVGKMLKDNKTPKDVVEEIYYRAFGRVPLPKEWDAVNKALAESPDTKQAVLEDLFWALLNSKEFYFTH
ncbi:cell surface protein [Verrucomicrobiaceae bacterium SCGC AG-212-N21]|nr:cell surface protein [Verrucomicrobiaceae bacterium SCGC AG-212-N21]